MRYHIRERAWSLTEAFVVRDDAGNAVFEVRGKFFHIGDNLVMYDRYTGQELVQIRQRVLSLLPHYEIYRTGQVCTSSSACLVRPLKLKAAMVWSFMLMVIYGSGISA